MATQLPDEKEERWHAKFGLAEFVGHVEKLQEIVDLANSSKLWSVDKIKLKKMLGWGLFIEEVVGSLHAQWQRDTLARALSSSDDAVLPRLKQARRWVLGSILGSAFLPDHPKPEALCIWIMGEYVELRTSQGFGEVGNKRRLGVLDEIVDDVCGVAMSRGDVGILSHAHSALLLYGGRRRLACVGCDGEVSGEGGTWQRAPSVYEMSVATAQKRAYASECYNTLLSDSDDGGNPEAGVLGDRATSFIEELTELARTDDLVLEILCLALLEPWRKTCFTGKTGTDPAVCGPSSKRHSDGLLQNSLKSMLLRQVLAFRNDARLWSFDKCLLRELSYRYEAFAKAYLSARLQSTVDDRFLSPASAR